MQWKGAFVNRPQAAAQPLYPEMGSKTPPAQFGARLDCPGPTKRGQALSHASPVGAVCRPFSAAAVRMGSLSPEPRSPRSVSARAAAARVRDSGTPTFPIDAAGASWSLLRALQFALAWWMEVPAQIIKSRWCLAGQRDAVRIVQLHMAFPSREVGAGPDLEGAPAIESRRAETSHAGLRWSRTRGNFLRNAAGRGYLSALLTF
jgi:hypothetical protein